MRADSDRQKTENEAAPENFPSIDFFRNRRQNRRAERRARRQRRKQFRDKKMEAWRNFRETVNELRRMKW